MSAAPDTTTAPAAETAPANTTTTTVSGGSGAVDDKDVEHWKTKINAVLSKPGEYVNSKSPEGSQAWHSGFFECFNPIDLCLLTYCLPCITFGKTHHRVHKDANLQGYEPINTSCMLFCASGCFGLFWIPMAIQRADIREKYNLQGDCITDIAASCCCGLCSLVQADKEAAFQEPLLAQNAAGDKAGYKPDAGMSYGQQQ
jgi:Cys-rich protein (TIGR01571 family)